MTEFIQNFLNCILAIKDNDLVNLKIALDILNSLSADETFKISDSDIYNMAINNEAFNYFLENFKTEDLFSLRCMWDIKANFIYEDYHNHKINTEELTAFIRKYINDISSPIYEYRHINLVRLALLNKNYDLIFEMKKSLNNIKEEGK